MDNVGTTWGGDHSHVGCGATWGPCGDDGNDVVIKWGQWGQCGGHGDHMGTMKSLKMQ